MARPKKQVSATAAAEELKEFKFLAEIREKELKILYKDLAILKDLVSTTLIDLSSIDMSDTVGEAAFKAGKAYVPLNRADDKLEKMLDDLYEANEFEHYQEIIDDINDQL